MEDRKAARAGQLPAGGPLAEIRGTFPRYPIPEAAGPRLERLLERVEVSGTTAIEYHCTPRWSIPARRIGDDMFFLVLAGRGGMRVEGRRSPLEPGDLAHWRRGREHAAWHDPERPLVVIALHYTALVGGSLPFGDAVGIPDRVRLGRAHPLAALIRECARAYALRPPGWSRGMEAAVAQLLLGLLHGGHLDATAAAAAADPLLARVEPALRAMREHLADPLPMPALAGLCGISVAQFRRLFQRALGCSPLTHLRRTRLAEACRLLRQRHGTVAQIAHAVGYAEPAYFARSFQAALGVPPGRWRASGHL